MPIKEISDKDFQKEVIESQVPVLVDFTAEWCGPCKALTPILEEVSREHKIKVVKIDIDDNEEIPEEYKVTNLPTLILFKNGIIVEKKVGLIKKEVLVKLVSSYEDETKEVENCHYCTLV